MKLTILGGAGFRTPLVVGAVFGSPEQVVTEVMLYDVDEVRLGLMLSILRAQQPVAADISGTTDLDAALDGASFVFSAIRVGGLAGRVIDERVALDVGVLGQETTGAGGIAYGLRTIPVALQVAARVRDRAPQAWFINFTNPAGMITQAVRQVLGDRVVGICDSPVGMARRVAKVLSVQGDYEIGYSGLNHLGWLQWLTVDGVDVLAQLLADPESLGRTEEGRLFGAEWLQTLGSIPNEYLYYYYFNRDAVASILGSKQTRGEFLETQQNRFYATAASSVSPADLWNDVRREREETYLAEARSQSEERDEEDLSGGYEGVALALMDALTRGRPTTSILNVPNRGTLAGLPDEAVVEVPCRVDSHGVTPLSTAQLRGHELGLVQQVKAVEELTIEAALTRSPRIALKAFATHPLVDSVTVARALLSGYAAAHPVLSDLGASGSRS